MGKYSLFSTLLAELSNCKHQTILFNQRRSAVWNWNSIKNLRKNNCKIINPSDLLKTDNKTLEILETKYRSKLSDFWLNEKELELIFSKNGVRFWPIMKDKFKKLYAEGEDKITTELDIVKLMKALRDMKILLKGTMMSDINTKFAIKHAPKNLLNMSDTALDDEEEEEEASHGHGKVDFSKLAKGEAPPPKSLRHTLSSNIKEK